MTFKPAVSGFEPVQVETVTESVSRHAALSVGDGFTIGEWRVHPQLGELRGSGGTVRLEPRTMDLLSELATRQGEVLSRQELLRAVWGDAFVGEEVLSHCIWELRRALGDDARSPRFIQTIPRRGYRLIPPVGPLQGARQQLPPAVVTLMRLGAFEPGDRLQGTVVVATEVARELLAARGGVGRVTPEGGIARFDRPVEAVRFAAELHARLAELPPAGDGLVTRLALHLAELRTVDPEHDWPSALDPSARQLADRLVAVCGPRQTLLTRGAFDLARSAQDRSPAPSSELRWLAHGGYRFDGIEESVDIFEVGEPGRAPLEPPVDRPGIVRLAEDGTILGWRPAPDQELAQRPGWRLERKLADGGFGEVWLARRDKTGDRRVFKFCDQKRSLGALKREVTLFRLLKEELGDRDDIARILDWDFTRSPYFIESEYTACGSVVEWAATKGGLAQVPLADRLELVAQTAEALAAAHSIGVLHKDVKPANVLIHEGPDGRPRARLADFGIGRITDAGRLDEAGITRAGLTETLSTTGSSSSGGTRLYMAPEILAGKTATLQADLYSLGVMLFQMVVADFERVLAPGWERDVGDELLQEEISALVDGAPERRPASAGVVAQGLRRLDTRRAERQAARLADAAARRSRRRRRWAAAVAAMATLLAGATSWQARRTAAEAARANREAETANRVSQFLVELFRGADPFGAHAGELTVREVLDRGAARVRTELVAEPRVQARLMGTIGAVYASLGFLEAAAPLLDDALALHRGLYGEVHPETAEGLLTLGRLQADQGDYDSAESHLQQALAVYRQLGDARRAETAVALNCLGQARYEAGRLEAAERALRQALEILAAPGGDAGELAATLNHLGLALYGRGAYAEAEARHRQAVRLSRELHGESHPRVAIALQNLAIDLMETGQLEAAEGAYREALRIHRDTLDDDHPELVTVLTNLATLRFRLGDYAAAEAGYREVLALRRRTLGEEHPIVAITLRLLGRARRELGDPETAATLGREALEMIRRLGGEGELAEAYILDALGEALLDLGESAEAGATLLRARDLFHHHLGEEHPAVVSNRDKLAGLDQHLGRNDAAEGGFRDALEMRRRLLGDDHPDTAHSLLRLGVFLLQTGRSRAAEPLAREALDILGRTFSPGNLHLARARRLLGACLIELGRDEEAEPLLRSADEVLSRATDNDTVDATSPSVLPR